VACSSRGTFLPNNYPKARSSFAHLHGPQEPLTSTGYRNPLASPPGGSTISRVWGALTRVRGVERALELPKPQGGDGARDPLGFFGLLW
jgi:hypothetical protein